MESILGSAAIKLLGTALTVLLSWRLWRFTVRPQLHPDQPKDYPYWIPFIGHVVGFFTDFNGAIGEGRKHFLPSKEPFSMTIAGQTIYVAVSAEDINNVWKNSKTISMDPIALDMFVMGNMSKKSRRAMFDLHPEAKYNFGNARPLAPREMSNEIHRQQLSGPRLEDLMSKTVLPGIMSQLNTLKIDHPAVISRSNGSLTVSVLQLCTHVFITQATDTFFGPKLRQTEPELIQAFEAWEQSNWKFLFQVPSIFAKDMASAKNTMASAFTRYFTLPQSERPGATFYVTATEDMLREVGLNEEDMAKFMLLQYWAIIGNVYKLAFWLVAHLSNNPSLVDEIRRETLPAVTGDSIDETYLLKECPKLESLFNEILRLTVSSSLARGIIEPSVVGGKVLKPGNKIMLPIQPLHLDSGVWGHDSATFQPDRFSKNSKLSKSLSYRPWGGGHTLCPGRFLARRSIYAFVAVLLSRYELELESDSFPTADGAKPSPGVVLVAQGQDVQLRCTSR